MNFPYLLRTAAEFGMLAGLLLASRQLSADDEKLQTIEVPAYGIKVHAPTAWRLMRKAENEYAFALSLPSKAGANGGGLPGGLGGYVTCELGVAPENLTEYQTRHQANDERERKKDQPRRLLELNELTDVDPVEFGADVAAALGKQLVCVWEYPQENGKLVEMRKYFLHAGTLYTFMLATSAEEYDAILPEFQQLVRTAKFSLPETGMQRMPNGFWMQREFRFAMKLPENWQPSFAPHDKVLMFATGATHEVFSDNLLVLASAAQKLDLEQVKQNLEESIPDVDPRAEVTCKIVDQGEGKALETVIKTQRGPFKLTILERRFQGQQRNYEVKFTCESAEFEKIEKPLREALDSFREVAPPENKTNT